MIFLFFFNQNRKKKKDYNFVSPIIFPLSSNYITKVLFLSLPEKRLKNYSLISVWIHIFTFPIIKRKDKCWFSPEIHNNRRGIESEFHGKERHFSDEFTDLHSGHFYRAVIVRFHLLFSTFIFEGKNKTLEDKVFPDKRSHSISFISIIDVRVRYFSVGVQNPEVLLSMSLVLFHAWFGCMMTISSMNVYVQ